MLSTDEFAQWSDKVVLFLHNTSHCKDDKYDSLLFEKGGNGFPTMSYLGADGRLLTQVGHVTPVAELEAAYQNLHAWQQLKADVAGGDTARAKELFLMEVEHGYATFAEAQARSREVKLSGDERIAVEQQLVNLEFRDILRSTPRDAMAQGGAKFHAMLQRGRVPNSSQITSYWQYMFAHAAAKRNVPLYENILAECRQRMAGDKRFRRYIGAIEGQLERLKQAVGDGK